MEKKYWIKFHTYLGFMPFLTMMAIGLYMVIARIEFGYFPTYGEYVDPTALGFSFLYAIGSILLFLTFPGSFIWIIMAMPILIIGIRDRSFRINHLSAIAFITGIALFFIFKYCYADIFLWYMD